MGRLNYIAWLIFQLSETAKSFLKLLRKNALIEWNSECEEAFEKLKYHLMNSSVLVPPTLGQPLILYLTIYSESLGAMLAKESQEDGKERAIYYLSKKLTASELNYFEAENTCAALVWVLHRLWQYTLHYQVLLVTKCDPIKYLLNQPALVGKLGKRQILISKFDIQYLSQKLVKGRVITDVLAENPGQNEDTDRSEDRIMSVDEYTWTMYFDGAVNLSGLGTEAVLISPGGQHYPVAAKLVFPCTNNIAEYEAYILGLQAAIEMRITRLKVFGDSALIILQTVGQWKTRDVKLLPYHKYLDELVEEFEDISFDYLSKTRNQFTDALATLSSMLQVADGLEVEPLKIEVLPKPAYCMTTIEEPDGKS